MSMLEKKFGPEVKREVLTQMVSDSIQTAIQDNDLKAVGDPAQLNIEAEEGTDITVTANVEVVPEFEIKDVSGVELDLKVVKVTDEDVDKIVQMYRERHAQKVPVTDRGVEKDDLIKIDFDGEHNGKPFEGGSAKDFVVQVGAEHLVGGFDEKIMGMQIGETRQVTINLPEAHPDPTLKGAEVEFQVTLKGIQVNQLPEVDDAFAKIADANKSYNTVDELKAGVRAGLEDYERIQAKKAARKDLSTKLGELHPIDIPERLVQEQVTFMVDNERKKAAEAAGTAAPAQEAPVEPTAEDQAKHREQAVKILQQELVLGKLGEQMNVEVTEDELNREMQGFASLMGGQGDMKKMKKEWAESGALLRLHTRMRREKILDKMMDQVQLKEEMVDRETVNPDN